MLLFSTYPLLNLFLRTHLLNLFYENKEVRKRDLVILNMIVSLFPLMFAMFWPAIGSIIAFSGAFAGFLIIYLLPVLVFLKKKYIRITNPLLAEAIDQNKFRVIVSNELIASEDEPRSGHSSSNLSFN